MDFIIQFLIDWGYWGLFIGSFVAGSVIPFSSEAVLVACIGPLGLDPMLCTLFATAGNVAGGMTCYWMGHLGNMEWIFYGISWIITLVVLFIGIILFSKVEKTFMATF